MTRVLPPRMNTWVLGVATFLIRVISDRVRGPSSRWLLGMTWKNALGKMEKANLRALYFYIISSVPILTCLASKPARILAERLINSYIPNSICPCLLQTR